MTEVDLVRTSRAGDVFHYRWTTRRCLKMINPNSKIKYLVIEGSNEPSLAGEYVMDVTEYSQAVGGDKEDIAYFQLKHSTKRVNQPFQLSDLKNTIEGFAKRFIEHEEKKSERTGTITFSVITNRKIDVAFKKEILAIVQGKHTEKRFLTTLTKYTQLSGESLKRFCSSFQLEDNEGNYADQKDQLTLEMSAFFAGIVESKEINNIIALIHEKVLPDTSGKITPEDVLQRFGVTSQHELFPAPAEFEALENPIQREQHGELLNQIINATVPVIIHASGGVGKSVVCRQLASTLPNGSVGLVYDCFGAGKYRNRSRSRHRFRDGLIQIVNELAVLGLCETLIPRSGDLDDALLRSFLLRLNAAGKALEQNNKTGFIAIFIDAADNAEMAAKEFGDSCFVKHLLREELPINCRIIASCRPERLDLLDPRHTVKQIPLLPFSETETQRYLRTHYPNASDYDALEFHRLTAGNPRVQANALDLNKQSLAEVLTSLGPGQTVDEQIARQLHTAIEKLKEHHTKVFQHQIDAICLGLANLHPFIPLQVLAAVAQVDETTIKSFVADLGRPLWISENSVQFRDEPTETWFRGQFSASSEQIGAYVDRLKPLAAQFNYVAEVLPTLLLGAEKYDELIELALSDELLPESPIDKRNVRIYRLQFSFKAALKQKKYADAAKLSLRAGEEMAGDKRQMELLSKNTDLIAPLQSPQRVQELAFRQLLGGAWDGSENIYSAALLSSVDDFKGEARGYLRSANSWLKLYFQERKKNKENHHNERLQDDDIAEMAFAHLNLFGTEALADFIHSWQPPELAFRITRLLVTRLIDASKFATIDELSQLACRNIYVMLAIADGLIQVSKFPSSSVLHQSLMLLSHRRTRIKREKHHWRSEELDFAIISFAEACAAANLCRKKIQRVLRHFFSAKAAYSVHSDYADSRERTAFIRIVALRAVLSGETDVKLDSLMQEEWSGNRRNYDTEQDIKRFEQVVGGLLPWYTVRALLLTGSDEDVEALIQIADQQSKKALAQRYQSHDRLPFELTQIRFELLTLNPKASDSALSNFTAELSGQNLKFLGSDRLNAVRVAFRLPHLKTIRYLLEQSCRDMILASTDEGPVTLADWYISLSRAVLSESPEDAKAYFDEAIDVVSKFGDEIVERWNAIVVMAKRTVEGRVSIPEIAYRFIRCAELVGERVAREKYWDREEAMEVCFKLHPSSAFAALSRWRDRDVGWLDRQLPVLAQEAVQSKLISAAAGWSLTAFAWDYGFQEFVELCIESETEPDRRQYMLDKAVRDFRLKGFEEDKWKELSDLAYKFSLKDSEIQKLLDCSERFKLPDVVDDDVQVVRKHETPQEPFINWDLLFADLDLVSAADLSLALERFKSLPAPRWPETFWKEVMPRVPEAKASLFLNAIVHAESADAYDIEYVLQHFPNSWRDKISVQRVWPKVIYDVGRRFASRYSNPYSLNHFYKYIDTSECTKEWLSKGLLEGLSGSCNLVSATTLFGFSSVTAAYISPEDAADVLNFGLARFENHIDSDFGDGAWVDWLIPPDSITDAFTGFIWSALGSPRSAIRWRAAHCVRRLVEAGCENEIDALIDWMSQGRVDAFGSKKYPFYNLHARQYLLIAIARAAIDSPQLFRKHHAIFAYHALESIPHALIQKFAADIALLIEQAFPATYSPEITLQLQQVGLSPFPIEKAEDYNKHFLSPWHERGEVNKGLELHFSYDFDRYWFEPLARVFGISSHQVEELAREIILKEWKIDISDDKYILDPRQNLWNYRYERETWHSHFSYPKTDDYRFYLSYHGMLAVAAKLLQAMPIVDRHDGYENAWLEWLQRHDLTRIDRCWLADRRDPIPLPRRAWLQESNSDNWRWEINQTDFLEELLLDRNDEPWLIVYGDWTDNNDNRKESFSVCSALVNPITSLSLLNALTTCSNPRDFYLSLDQEEDEGIKNSFFTLEGWIYRDEQSKYLDEYDPLAGDFPYPFHAPGKAIIEQFKLESDIEQREWRLPNGDQAVLVSELWGDKPPERSDKAMPHGGRILGSFSFLKNLCTSLNRDLIIKVEIERHYQYSSYRSEPDDEIKYPPPYCKVYLFSADGKLRDTTMCYRIRQSAG
ncbi:MAG: hypothetical protein M8364_06830 [Methylobacter sp.]|uniref:hypothetical protein n=1 Tax=Methylobacter sp. TaxID=2051955 RepID=UPI0025857B41|nr:hypothetical protein [Methylobacter sp.]MCL7420601.1 hypothetical protein [Methylobacter sp.]